MFPSHKWPNSVWIVSVSMFVGKIERKKLKSSIEFSKIKSNFCLKTSRNFHRRQFESQKNSNLENCSLQILIIPLKVHFSCEVHNRNPLSERWRWFRMKLKLFSCNFVVYVNGEQCEMSIIIRCNRVFLWKLGNCMHEIQWPLKMSACTFALRAC